MPPRGAARRPSAPSPRPLDGLLSAPRRGAPARGFRIQSSAPDPPECALPLQELRQRILSAAAATCGAVLEDHKRRAWEMAFGQADGIEVATMELSLVCPYSRVAMRHPVRCRDCRHLQCCDLESWVALLERHRSMRDPSAPCPVCERRVSASHLEVDQWQLHVIAEMPPGTHMLVLDADGSYRSGDVSRDQRRAEVTEVIDATQASCSPPASVDDSDMGGRSSSPPAPRLTAVKRERSSEEMPPSMPLLETEDTAVVARYDDAGKAWGRALPSLARLWIAHCPGCRRALLKNEGAEVDGCAQCSGGGSSVSRGLTLVRSFPDSPVSLELTADGTLLLCGVDAMASHLLRAGFSRAMYVDETGTGLWYTTAELSRYELDFLEACCLRLSRGESVEDVPVVPALFRIPRRRAPRDGLSQTSNGTSYFRVHLSIA